MGNLDGHGAIVEALQALAAQSQATTSLLARQGAAAGDPLQTLMAGSEEAGGSAKLPGAKGAAAMELFRRQLESNPANFTSTVRANARRALTADASESDARANSMRVFFERHVNFGKARASHT